MKDKGFLFWKKRWYSLCSKHQTYDKDCYLCHTGTWENTWIIFIGNIIFKISPDLWIHWHNHKIKHK